MRIMITMEEGKVPDMIVRSTKRGFVATQVVSQKQVLKRATTEWNTPQEELDGGYRRWERFKTEKAMSGMFQITGELKTSTIVARNSRELFVMLSRMSRCCGEEGNAHQRFADSEEFHLRLQQSRLVLRGL